MLLALSGSHVRASYVHVPSLSRLRGPPVYTVPLGHTTQSAVQVLRILSDINFGLGSSVLLTVIRNILCGSCDSIPPTPWVATEKSMLDSAFWISFKLLYSCQLTIGVVFGSLLEYAWKSITRQPLLFQPTDHSLLSNELVLYAHM
jgi:hypothetical protein